MRPDVMGARGGDHTEAPSDDGLARMAALTHGALDAGAIGFATSRTDVHRTKDGTNIGTLTASERELLTIADAMRAAGKGVTYPFTGLGGVTGDKSVTGKKTGNFNTSGVDHYGEYVDWVQDVKVPSGPKARQVDETREQDYEPSPVRVCCAHARAA